MKSLLLAVVLLSALSFDAFAGKKKKAEEAAPPPPATEAAAPAAPEAPPAASDAPPAAAEAPPACDTLEGEAKTACEAAAAAPKEEKAGKSMNASNDGRMESYDSDE